MGPNGGQTAPLRSFCIQLAAPSDGGSYLLEGMSVDAARAVKTPTLPENIQFSHGKRLSVQGWC